MFCYNLLPVSLWRDMFDDFLTRAEEVLVWRVDVEQNDAQKKRRKKDID